MQITDVKVRPVSGQSNRVKAYCSITFDNAFVVKDIRIVQGTNGFIVAMPVKKMTFNCFRCGVRNPVNASFCMNCGSKVRAPAPKQVGDDGRPITQTDVAHPINLETRKMIEKAVLEEYNKQIEKFKQSLQPVVAQQTTTATDTTTSDTPAPVETQTATPAPQTDTAQPQPDATQPQTDTAQPQTETKQEPQPQ